MNAHGSVNTDEHLSADMHRTVLLFEVARRPSGGERRVVGHPDDRFKPSSISRAVHHRRLLASATTA